MFSSNIDKKLQRITRKRTLEYMVPKFCKAFGSRQRAAQLGRLRDWPLLSKSPLSS